MLSLKKILTEIAKNIKVLNTKTTLDIITSKVAGSIVHFTDGADSIPMKDVLVHIEPIQEGSGDPSLTNVRAISGLTGVKVTRCGKNLLIMDADTYPLTRNGVTWTKNADGSITANGTATSASQTYFRISNSTVTVPSTMYRFGGCPDGGGSEKFDVYPWDSTANARPQRAETDTRAAQSVYNSTSTGIFYMPKNHVMQLTLRIQSGVTVENLTFYPFCVPDGTDASWSTPVGQTYDITFPSEVGTVYGGILNVTKGELIVDRAIISSYTGEILPSTWISDRDVYSEGMTPTTGAQVCYYLTTPITYQLTPQEITSLLGENNLWADTGNSEVEYVVETIGSYVDKKIPIEIVNDYVGLLNSTADEVIVLNDNSYYGSGEKVRFIKSENVLDYQLLKRNNGDYMMPAPLYKSVSGSAPYTQIGNVVASYVNKDHLSYGNSKGAFDTICETQIDCSTFVQLVLQDIPYEKSRYNGNENNIIGKYSGGNFFRNIGSKGGKGRIYGYLANEIALFFAEQNRLFYIDYKKEHPCSQIQVGDILFESDPSLTIDPTANSKYLWIHHISIVLQVYPESDMIVIAEGGISHAGQIFSQAQGMDEDNIFKRNVCKITTLKIKDNPNQHIVYARPKYNTETQNVKNVLNIARIESNVTMSETDRNSKRLATLRLNTPLEKDKMYTLSVKGQLPIYSKQGVNLRFNVETSTIASVPYIIRMADCKQIDCYNYITFSFVPNEDIKRMTALYLYVYADQSDTVVGTNIYHVDEIGLFEGLLPEINPNVKWFPDKLILTTNITEGSTKNVWSIDGRLHMRLTATINYTPTKNGMAQIATIDKNVLPQMFGVYEKICLVNGYARQLEITIDGIISAYLIPEDANKKIIFDIVL